MVNWESILKEAAEQVQGISDSLKGRAERVRGAGQGAGGDITMKVDADAEKSIMDLVRGQVSDVRFVTEEAGVVGPSGATWTVIIDPIDGSANYARGLPFYCTSIAVLDGASLEHVEAWGGAATSSAKRHILPREGTARRGTARPSRRPR